MYILLYSQRGLRSKEFREFETIEEVLKFLENKKFPVEADKVYLVGKEFNVKKKIQLECVGAAIIDPKFKAQPETQVEAKVEEVDPTKPKRRPGRPPGAKNKPRIGLCKNPAHLPKKKKEFKLEKFQHSSLHWCPECRKTKDYKNFQKDNRQLS